MSFNDTKISVQKFGRLLSNMTMPNIVALITWGLFATIFMPDGWYPNVYFAKILAPALMYLLPILIGYYGGKIVYGEKGGVIGALATLGLVVGSSVPMFLGAMATGPSAAYILKVYEDSIKKSKYTNFFGNYNAEIIGVLFTIFAYVIIQPIFEGITDGIMHAINWLIGNNLIALSAIFVEPAKILFLNNAINQGILTPLGFAEVHKFGYSLLFLVESNPGPGLGILLAYTFFGKGMSKKTAPAAIVMQFFGGLHEVYFPYILMKPKLILAVILGGMTGIITLVMTHSGLIAPPSPGSIISILLLAPKDSILGVILSIFLATTVSFIVATFLIKVETITPKEHSDSYDENSSTSTKEKVDNKKDVGKQEVSSLGFDYTDLKDLKRIVVACDAGMGSSAMGAGVLRKKVKQAGLSDKIEVTNKAINKITPDDKLLITHKDLTNRAREKAPNSLHISLNNFLNKDS
ncbi:MAG: PTS transporter subunit EIIC, partial [Psittacicella sp.]